jgi:ABC-2 type transport system ATP-binding protein
MELTAGHIYGLLGRNGTGKSTLLRSMAGLLRPQKGSIDIMGYEPHRRQPSFLRRVFMVPEDIKLPGVRVDQWLEYMIPFYPGFDRGAFEQYYNSFELPPGQLLTDLSYGQQKKALISFALASHVSLLLLDEPTNGLDIISKNILRKLIAGAADAGQCILISTHQVRDLELLIDRILIIDEGRILFHQGLDLISEKLLFKYSLDEDEERQAIYSENCFKGKALILPNYLMEDSRPDLEMLYKAINTDENRINAHFK